MVTEGAIVSMVDSHLNLIFLFEVHRKIAQAVKKVLIKRLGNIADCVHTLTSDNGK